VEEINENEIRAVVIDCAATVHMRLGPSQQESVYEALDLTILVRPC